MSEAKTYVFGNEGNNLMGLLAPLMQQRGLDPNMVMAMMNNRNGGFGGEGGWFIWVIFLFFLMGWGGNGWGGFRGQGNSLGDAALGNLINNDNGRELLMSAIQGNSTAISLLATTLNCDINAVQSAVQSVSQQICQVGNQVGLSSLQVINAIQQGNMSIAQQLSNCCCDVKDAITRGNYENQIANLNQTNQLQNSIDFVNRSVERGIATNSYEMQSQTCSLQNTINDGISKILAGQQAAEMRELQNKIDALRDLNSQKDNAISQASQTAVFNQMIGLATAPIAQAVAGLTKEVSDIQCKLPLTVTLPYSCATAVPTAAVFGLNGLSGYGFGWNNNLWA